MTHHTPNFVTFTGVDAGTDLDRCRDISSRYAVEWGFLLSETRTDNRYTGIQYLKLAAEILPKTALHLCGSAARRAMKTGHLPEMPDGVGRVQINLRSNQYTNDGLTSLASQRKIIQQTRDKATWPSTPLNVSPLLDCSGGRGAEIISWPNKPPAQLVGYAGGLRPGNVRHLLYALPEHYHGFWIDMETGVRTDDWFDLDKCEAVCREIWP